MKYNLKILLVMTVYFIATSLYSQFNIQELQEHFESSSVIQSVVNGLSETSEKIRNGTLTNEVQLLILTTEDFKMASQEFAKIKITEGINTEVVTTITTGIDSLSIRNWLTNNTIHQGSLYPGLRYLLIIGNADLVPTTILPYNYNGNIKYFTTDYYYSNIKHNFPAIDNPEKLCDIEVVDDLIVGRIPVADGTSVDNFIQKYIAFRDRGLSYGDKWKFVTSNLSRTEDCEYGSSLLSRLSDEVSFVSVTIVDESEQNNPVSIDPKSNEIQGSALMFKNEINSDNFSLLYTMNHANFDVIEIADNKADIDSATYRFDGHSTIFSTNPNYVANGAGGYPAYSYYNYSDLFTKVQVVHWSDACLDAEQTRGTGHDSIGETGIVNPNGPVFYYGNSFINYPNMSIVINEDILNYSQFTTIGVAISQAWMERPYYAESEELVMLRLNRTIFGDPSMRLFSASYGQLKAKKRGDIITAIDKSGQAIDDALLIFTDEYGNLVEQGYSPYILTNSIVTHVHTSKMNYKSYSNSIINLDKSATIEYSMDFENGVDKNWDIYTENGASIKVTDSHYPYNSDFHMVFENDDSQYYNSSAQVILDLSQNYDSYVLNFWCKEWGSTPLTERKIKFSDDYGASFVEVYEINNLTNDWENIELNIKTLAIQHGMSLNSKFFISFYNYGSGYIPTSGFAIDNVQVYGIDESYLMPQITNAIITGVNCYPNPFNPSMSFKYEISKQSNVKIEIFNIKGQIVKNYDHESKSKGLHSVVWNISDKENREVTSGIYFIRVKAGGESVTKKITLMK